VKKAVGKSPMMNEISKADENERNLLQSLGQPEE